MEEYKQDHMDYKTNQEDCVQPDEFGSEILSGNNHNNVPIDEQLPALTYYELIYGVLFDPVQTMKRVVNNPPLGTTLIIIILLTLVGLLSSLYTSAHAGSSNLGLEMGMPLHQAKYFSEAIRSAAPVLAILGAIFFFVKWFFYSGFLHLLADFYGGKGNARTVFVVYGLAGLPEILVIPLNVITTLFMPSLVTVVSTFGSILMLIWGLFLLTIGLRESQQFSTGRALAVIFTPIAAILLIGIITIAGLMATVARFIPTSW